MHSNRLSIPPPQIHKFKRFPVFNLKPLSLLEANHKHASLISTSLPQTKSSSQGSFWPSGQSNETKRFQDETEQKKSHTKIPANAYPTFECNTLCCVCVWALQCGVVLPQILASASTSKQPPGAHKQTRTHTPSHVLHKTDIMQMSGESGSRDPFWCPRSPPDSGFCSELAVKG